MATRKKHPPRAKTAYGTLSEERLRSLLDHDFEAGSIVTYKANTIYRKHYAQRLGCSRSALWRFKHVFSEYERKFGIISGPALHLDEMVNWLTSAYDARELEYRGGKLDRGSFRKQFHLSNNVTASCLEIREIFEKLDVRARTENYLPLKKQIELDRVKLVLADSPCLTNNRMNISKTKLAKMAGVTMNRFREKPFADAIASCEEEIMTEVMASKIDPFVHGRVFRFSILIPAWPMIFLERVGIRFKQTASGMAKSSVKRPYLQLVAALDWIGPSTNPHCKAVLNEAMENGRVLSASKWEDALFAYRDYLIAGNATDRLVDSNIKSLRIALSWFSTGGVLPIICVPLRGIKNARRRGGHLRSVAEAGAVNRGDKESEYIAFARSQYLNARKKSSTDQLNDESDEFIYGLAEELKSVDNLPIDPAAAILCVLERRLCSLRDQAEAIIDAAIRRHQDGRALLSQTKIDGEEFVHLCCELSHDEYKRNKMVSDLFPRDGKNDKQGIANLLGLIDQQYGGIPPPVKTAIGSYKEFFAKRYLAYGGLKTIVPLMHPDPDAVAAVLTLYLIESGANISVGRRLDRECLEVSDLEGHLRITGHKARAKGKPIIVDLVKSSPTVRAMEWLLSAGGALQAGTKEDGDRLFLTRIQGKAQLMPSNWYTQWFTRFAASTPTLQGIRLVPSMIRPSVLLRINLENDGRLATGIAIAQHGSKDAQGYQQKFPTRLLYDENIRRFHTRFETLVMSGIDAAATKLGITKEQFEERQGDLRATGLGTFCKDQRGRLSETLSSCSTLDCWNECPHMLVVAEVESIASLQLWHESLIAAQPAWERDRAERWNQIWLPWLCFTVVVKEKMMRSPSLLKIWSSAYERADEISRQPGYVPPRPW